MTPPTIATSIFATLITAVTALLALCIHNFYNGGRRP